ncbi:MAG: hypothetical protein RJA34_1760 [Pseudomonadota bacterium]|jgi:hypothetical protein
MKKTLVAVAVLAVSGAAFAEAKITGGVAVVVNHAAGATTLGRDGSSFAISSSEDLGGGLKVAGSFDVVTNARATTNSAISENMSMSLAGAFGTVAYSQLALGTTFLSAGESLPTDVNGALGGDTAGSKYSYTLPTLVDGLTLAVAGTQGGVAGFDTGNLLGNGSKTTYSAAYAKGAYSVSVSYRPVDTRTRVIGSYDFGFAKLSAGADSNDQTELAVTAPMGALTLGLHYGQDTSSTAVGAVNGKAHGTAVAAVYALSKSTNVNFSIGNTSAGNTSRVGLNYGF